MIALSYEITMATSLHHTKIYHSNDTVVYYNVKGATLYEKYRSPNLTQVGQISHRGHVIHHKGHVMSNHSQLMGQNS